MRNRTVPTLSEEDRAFVERLVVTKDAEVLALNKPSGLPVQTRGNRLRNLDHLLWAFARSNGKRPRLVHRIDTGTSGIVLAAQTHPSAVNLSAQFEAREAKKTYLALVTWDGRGEQEGVIETKLETEPGRPPRAVVSKSGKPARTSWRVLDLGEGAALLSVSPLTGRMHQIRAHLASIGLPLIGDPLYGGPEAGRLMLHAKLIEVVLLNGARRVFEAPVGEDWWAELRKAGLTQSAP